MSLTNVTVDQKFKDHLFRLDGSAILDSISFGKSKINAKHPLSSLVWEG